MQKLSNPEYVDLMLRLEKEVDRVVFKSYKDLGYYMKGVKHSDSAIHRALSEITVGIDNLINLRLMMRSIENDMEETNESDISEQI